MVQSLTPLRLGHVLLGQRIFLHGTLKVPHNLFEHDAVLVDPRELVPDGLDVTRVLEEVVDELLLLGHLLRDDEQAVEKVGDEILARFERQVRQQQSLVANALGPGEQDAGVAEDDDVILGDVEGVLRIADDLLELGFERVAVQVPERPQLRRDLLRDEHVDLVSVHLVAVEDHLEELPLVVRAQRFGHLAAVNVYVGHDAREVIERDVVEDRLHHRFELQSVQNGAVALVPDSKVFNLRDALVLGELNLGFDVDPLRGVARVHRDLREAHGNFQARLGGVSVDLCGEVSALDSVVRAELLRELHDLVTSKGDPLPDEDHQPRERHLDVKFVAQVARARRRLLRAVCVRRERPLEVSNGEG